MKALDRIKDDWLLASEIHKLEARLWRKSQREKIQVVMVTSAGRGDGKSTTVAYLATALGLHPDRRILAVDLDLREPKLNTHFEAEVKWGWSAILNGECSIGDAIVKTDLPSLDLVLPRPEGEDPGLLLRTSDLASVFVFFRRSYDLILVDVPALIPVADTSALLPLVDGVVLMAMAGKTTRPHLSRAREICLGMDAKILGLIVGNLHEAAPEYSGESYGYGYGYPRGPGPRLGKEDDPAPRG